MSKTFPSKHLLQLIQVSRILKSKALQIFRDVMSSRVSLSELKVLKRDSACSQMCYHNNCLLLTTKIICKKKNKRLVLQ